MRPKGYVNLKHGKARTIRKMTVVNACHEVLCPVCKESAIKGLANHIVPLLSTVCVATFTLEVSLRPQNWHWYSVTIFTGCPLQ